MRRTLTSQRPQLLLPVALMGLTACAAPARQASPPTLQPPDFAAMPCSLYRLPEVATVADLEAGYATRGAQLAECEAKRRLAIETLQAEHELEARWRADAEKRLRPWWRFW